MATRKAAATAPAPVPTQTAPSAPLSFDRYQRWRRESWWRNEMGDKQSHFILSAMPQSCAFCLPGGPEQLVEIKSKTPVKYTFDPIVLTGKLAVMKDDPTGVFYRLTDAVPAK